MATIIASTVQTHLKNVHETIVNADDIPNPPAPSQRSSLSSALAQAPMKSRKAGKKKKVKKRLPNIAGGGRNSGRWSVKPAASGGKL